MDKMDSYNKYLAEGRCPKCGGKRDREGRTLCSKCWERDRLYKLKYKSQHPDKYEKYNAQAVIRYNERKAAGICTRCGKQPSAEGRALCRECLDKCRHEYRKATRAYTKLKKNQLPILLAQFAKAIRVNTYVSVYCYLVNGSRVRRAQLRSALPSNDGSVEYSKVADGWRKVTWVYRLGGEL